MSYMDENGDAEGNYTLLARVPFSSGYSMQPVGLFQWDKRLPVSIILCIIYAFGIYFDIQIILKIMH